MIVLFLCMSASPSPSYISDLFDEIYPESLTEESVLRKVLEANQKIYDDVEASGKFLNTCGVDVNRNLGSIYDYLHLCPSDSKIYVEEWLNSPNNQAIISRLIEGINKVLSKLKHLIKLLESLISIVDKSCCNGSDEYEHGANNLPEYLRDLIYEIDGKPESDSHYYSVEWDVIKFRIEDYPRDEFWEAIRENGRYEYWNE